MKLDKLRDQIDKIDQEILFLIKKRFEIVRKISLIKKGEDYPIEDKAREKEILERISKLAKELKLGRLFLTRIFKLIFQESKKNQSQITTLV